MSVKRDGAGTLDDVSRETLDRLETYADLLCKWQPKINLVSPHTLEDLWARHFMDSAQIMHIAPPNPKRWVDLGSGAGFPGLVCAILSAEIQADTEFVLIESDARKCAFLREVSRQTGMHVKVVTTRIETAPPQDADVVSARALAPLRRLLPWANRHLAQDGHGLFLKGAQYKAELEDVTGEWQMKVNAVPSTTSADAAILDLSEIKHVRPS
ncbi:MAG: 16S rRNA (guanine(527)-N(7))-methyltransferase RsmG [Octadecabacter sp.]|nr:16S rRNA (guanine(527)-N(7))-methyltransferase RsmG [Octadecabacter sp.]